MSPPQSRRGGVLVHTSGELASVEIGLDYASQYPRQKSDARSTQDSFRPIRRIRLAQALLLHQDVFLPLGEPRQIEQLSRLSYLCPWL